MLAHLASGAISPLTRSKNIAIHSLQMGPPTYPRPFARPRAEVLLRPARWVAWLDVPQKPDTPAAGQRGGFVEESAQ
jgi:hypothetical protein